MASPKHLNDRKCAKCEEIFNRYAGFHQPLKDWFNKLQIAFPDAHIAYAGRGRVEQEEFFAKGTSKARWGESPHNYNLAIDLFQLSVSGARWDLNWYRDIIGPEVKKADWLTHGLNFTKFKDAPHIEIKSWNDMVKQGIAKLVE